MSMAGDVTDEDFGYRMLTRSFGDLDDVGVLVGIRQDKGSQVPEGGTTTLAGYASANEFGAVNSDGSVRVPERSFLRSTLDENEGRYGDGLERALGAVVDGTDTVEHAFGIVGERAVGDVRRKIGGRVPPPNAPSTIRRKKSSMPLIDSGHLRQSIDHVVVKGDGEGE